MTIGKPTPTAAEMTAHMRHEHIEEKEPDGSPEQVINPAWKAAADELKKKKLAEDEARKPKPEVKKSEPVVEETRATEADHKRSTYHTRSSRADKDDKA